MSLQPLAQTAFFSTLLACLLGLALQPCAHAVIVNPLVCDVSAKGEVVGQFDIKISSFGLGGGLVGIQGLFGSFNVTKKKGDGSMMTVAELEAFLGQDHLNWFQKVVGDTHPQRDASGTPLTPPYIDPPKDGYSDLWADKTPWYWNETPRPAGEMRPEAGKLSDRVKGSSLEFEDFPSVVSGGAPVAGGKVDFDTFLVSDFGNKSYQVLGLGFSWSITMETVAGHGVFPHVTKLEKSGKFKDEYAKEITDQFGYTQVPEPSTLLLLGSGLIGLAGWRRRRPSW